MNFTIPTPNRSELRSFGLIFGGIVAVLFGLLLPWLFELTYRMWPWYFAGVFFAVAIILPIILKPIYFIWMYFGLAMSKITTPLIMGLAFFLVVFPIGLLMRIFRSDPLGLRIDPTLKTYRSESEKITKENLERPF